MPYSTLETSLQDGRPIELYIFTINGVEYLYTSADQDVTLNSKTYISDFPISRSALEHTVEAPRASIQIKTSRDLPVVGKFAIAPPSEVVAVTILRMHFGDTEAIVLWMGRVLNVTWSTAEAEIRCESVFSSLKRVGLRRMYQKSCPHVLYSTACGVNRASFGTAATITAISGLTLTIPAAANAANGYYLGGYIELTLPTGEVERRAVKSHTGSAVEITFPINGLVAGNAATIYPGCPHTTSVCSSRFNNLLNYGGFPHIPQKNPFGGSPIY